MKARLLAMAAFSVILVTGALLWLMDAKVQEERKAASEVGLRGPVNALSQALQADIRGLRRALPPGATLNKDRIDWEAFKPFFALTQIRIGKNQSQILQYANDGQWPQVDWSQDMVASMISATGAAADGEAVMTVVESPNKKKILITLLREGDRQWAAFAGLDFLQGLLDQQKGPKGWLGILSSDGEVLAHSVGEYVGTKVSEGSLSEQIRLGSAARGFETRKAKGADSSLVAFEKPEHTNLIIVAARSLGEMQGERRKTLILGGVAGLGLLLLCLSFFWSLLTSWETGYQEMLAKARATPAISKSENPVIQPSTLLKERQEAFTRIASAIGHELRSPIVSILGYAQMILAGSQDAGMTGPAESILRETRSARDLVDKLLAFAGDTPEEKKKARVETALSQVLKEYDHRFTQKHIKVTKELRETSEVQIAVSSLGKAIRHLLNNAMEAMERLPKKELSIKLLEDPENVTLEIRDNGEGIDANIQERVFDPFFSTRQAAQHLGMGLPAALGLVREQGGELRLESTVGKGTTATLTIPKAGKVVHIAGTPTRLQTEQVVAIPAGLPQMARDEKTVSIPVPSSPVDVDIENLLDGAVPPMPATVPIEPDEEPAAPTPLETAPSSVASNDDKVTAPKFAPPTKASPLDSVPVGVRRPGTRF